MKQTRIKICGITRQQDMLSAVHAGADAIGLVFYEPSSRAVQLEQASQILEGVPPFVTVTALFVDPEESLVQSALRELPIDLLQFHGSEDASYCASFGMPYMKALRVSDGSGLDAAIAAYSDARAVLLDTYHPQQAGGTGQRFDWGLIPAEMAGGIVLAGGLKVDNVGNAVRQVQPAGVDVSGGVESQAGIKSPQLIEQFIAAVRQADRGIAEAEQ